jgi:hypothetical protein
MSTRWLLTGLLAGFFLCNTMEAGAAEFTYRGVKFGMTREGVSKLVPLIPRTNQALGRAGSTAKAVYFQFDEKDSLYGIELNYLIPEASPIMRRAMRRALQEKYAVVNPSEKVWDLGDAVMTFEEYNMGGQAYLKVIATHKRLYDEYLDRLATQLGASVQD